MYVSIKFITCSFRYVNHDCFYVRFAHAICTFGARYAFSASAILFRIRNSDMFARGERGGKYALYKSSRRAVRGISLAVRQISQAVLISQIREDLYRFSLSAFADKLNFPRGSKTGVVKVKGLILSHKFHRKALKCYHSQFRIFSSNG